MNSKIDIVYKLPLHFPTAFHVKSLKISQWVPSNVKFSYMESINRLMHESRHESFSIYKIIKVISLPAGYNFCKFIWIWRDVGRINDDILKIGHVAVKSMCGLENKYRILVFVLQKEIILIPFFFVQQLNYVCHHNN